MAIVDAALECVQEWKDDSVSDAALILPRAAPLKRLDISLFVAVLEALKHPSHVKIAQTIEARGTFGSGRVALRIVDRAMNFEGQCLSMTAHQELGRLRASSAQDLAAVLPRMDLLLSRIPNIDQEAVFEHLRRLTKHIPEAAVIMGTARMAPKGSITSENVIDALKTMVEDERFSNELDGGGRRRGRDHANAA